MVGKHLALFVIVSVVNQGLPHAVPENRSLVEITLVDEYYTFITNNLIGKTLTIPKSFLDTLESCHVIFPNGLMYEAFPNDQLPAGPIVFLHAAQPFVSCGIGFLGASVQMSGTYELISMVDHSGQNYRSLTRQRFHLTLVESDPW